MLSRPVLLYDGSCGFCRAWVSRLARWDRRGAIALVPLQQRGQLSGLPEIPEEALLRAIHLVLPDGTYFWGGNAVPVLLRYLPGGALIRPIYRIPGTSWVTGKVYDWVAARRHRLGCGGDHCQWVPPH